MFKTNFVFANTTPTVEKGIFTSSDVSKVITLRKRDPYKKLGLLKPIYFKGEYKKKQAIDVYTNSFIQINFKEKDVLNKGSKLKQEIYKRKLMPWELARLHKRRKMQRGLPKVIISESENNIFGVVVTALGKLLISSSSGKMRVKKRKTSISVDLLGQVLAKHLVARALFFYELVFIGKVSKLMRNMLRGLRKIQSRTRLVCKRIKIITIIAHNGVRLQVAPRK